MSTATTTAGSNKASRLLMGQLTAPIPAVRVLAKGQSHNFEGQTAVSWAVVTPEGTVVKATTYNGNLGKNFNLGDHNTTPIPTDTNSKDHRKMFKGYEEVGPDVALPAFISRVGATGLPAGAEGQDEAADE